MLTLIGALLGLATSTLPSIVDIFKARQRDAHELRVMEANRIAAKDEAERRLAEAEVRAAGARNQAIYSTIQPTGTWTDSYRATVRPTITYAFFFLFCAVKICHLQVVMAAGAGAPEAMLAVWDEETGALFATIIAFWFGSRVMRRGR